MKNRILCAVLALLMIGIPALATRASDLAEGPLADNAAEALAERGEKLCYEVTDCVLESTALIYLDSEILVRQDAEGTLWLVPDAIRQSPDGALSMLVFPEEGDLELYRLEALQPLDPDEFMVVEDVQETGSGMSISGIVDDPELVYDLLSDHIDLFEPGDTLKERCLFDAAGHITAIERDLVRASGGSFPLSRTKISQVDARPDLSALDALKGPQAHTLTWHLDPLEPDGTALVAGAPEGVALTCVLTDAYESIWLDEACTIPAETNTFLSDATVYSRTAYEALEEELVEGEG